MDKELLKILVCPYDGTSFENIYDDKLDLGILFCNNCLRWYPIKNNIPIIYRDEDRNISELSVFDYFNNKLPKEFTESGLPFNAKNNSNSINQSQYFDYDPEFYDDLLDSDYIRKIELEYYKNKIECNSPINILELGCGSGRMTLEIAKTNKNIIAVDYSFQMLLKMKNKIDSASLNNIKLICCDISFLPIKNIKFDSIVSYQVFEHFPKSFRSKTYNKINELLAADGSFHLSVYNWSLAKKIYSKKISYNENEYGKTKEQYWFNFTSKELKTELQECFEVQNISGIRNIPARSIVDKINMAFVSKIFYVFDKFITKIGLGKYLGHLLYAIAKKKL